ncbi:hypothetical protein PRZ48_000266 [Zasmidium cellare]|uniref:PrpF protein n=1 Tax=Zasmidium cellare TaxID=395010 RepID=A0ABR0EYS7_ZASCE|nr:hypothetical protein PRZ48_000266 [Zasmidium cellare]
MRAGTSKGLYLHRQHLPLDQADWTPILLRAIGSQDADPRQLNGVGGATSTTSKVAVVSRSKRAGVDVEYTFVQCAVGVAKLDFTGNCGNIASGVAPFAVDEGLVAVKPGQREVSVRIFNTNTSSILISTISLDSSGHFLEDGDYRIPGVMSTGSAVQMAFSKPAGSMTGALLPSKSPTNILHLPSEGREASVPILVSAVDAANPFIFVDSSTMPDWYHQLGSSNQESLSFIEAIRRRGAVLMGLAKDEEQASQTRGTPKIAVLTPSRSKDGRIEVTSFSMGKVHSSLQLTGAVCLASAACTEGTVAHRIRQKGISHDKLTRRDSPHDITIQTVPLRHTGGDMDVDVRLSGNGSIEDVTVFRTARRLFEDKVYYLM